MSFQLEDACGKADQMKYSLAYQNLGLEEVEQVIKEELVTYTEVPIYGLRDVPVELAQHQVN